MARGETFSLPTPSPVGLMLRDLRSGVGEDDLEEGGGWGSREIKEEESFAAAIVGAQREGGRFAGFLKGEEEEQGGMERFKFETAGGGKTKKSRWGPS